MTNNQQYDDDEEVYEYRPWLANAIVAQLKDENYPWNRDEMRKMAGNLGDQFLILLKRQDTMKRSIANILQLSNKETNRLLSSDWPDEQLDFMGDF